jgi:hypothetical protein
LPQSTLINWFEPDYVQIYESNADSFNCPIPRFQYNLVNGQTEEIAPYDPSEIREPFCLFYKPILSPDQRYLLIPNHPWEIYDYDNRILQQAFPWFDQPGVYPYDVEVRWGQNGVTVIIPIHGDWSELGSPLLKIGVGLNLSDILGNEDPTYLLTLPSNNAMSIYSRSSPDGRYVVLELLAEDSENIDETEYRLYVLDILENTIIDYCLDPALTSLSQTSQTGHFYFSPDGRYLAWSIHDQFVSENELLETVILDVQSGLVARIEGYEVLGWINK